MALFALRSFFISKKSILSSITLAIAFLVTALPSLADGPSGTTTRDPQGISATLFVDTPVQNRFGGHITVNVGRANINDLSDALRPAAGEAIEVVIVVPKNARADVREDFLTRVREQMQRYPNARYILKESFVDTQADVAAMEAKREELHQITAAADANGTSTPQTRQVAEQVERSIDAGIAETRALEESWTNKFSRRLFDRLGRTHPYNTVIAARAVAMMKFTVASVVLIGKYGFQNPLVNPSSYLIGFLSGTVSAAFGYNAKRYSNWCTSHQFPFFKDSLPVRAYNRSGVVKSATINFVRSLGLSGVMRWLAHVTGQVSNGVPVASPFSWDFVISGLPLTTLEIFSDGAMDVGTRSLEQKRIMNHQSRSYVQWLVGILDTTMHGLFRANSVRSAYTVGSISVGTKIGLWVLGKLAPTPPRRFVFISDEVSQVRTAAKLAEAPTFKQYAKALFKSFGQAIANRRSGKYSVSDREMVEQDLSLGEAWTTVLSEKDMNSVQNDDDLTQDDFSKMLNLMDTDRDLANRLWQARNAARARGVGLDLVDACANALGSVSGPKPAVENHASL